MMKKIFLLPAATLLLAACGNSVPKDSYVITGEVEGLPDSTVLVLEPLSHTPEDVVGEAMVIDGKFKFEGKAEQPLAVFLHVKDRYGAKGLMLENGKTEIKGKVEASGDSIPYYNFDAITVAGSPLTDKYYSLMSRRDTLNVMYQAMNEKYSEVSRKLGEARGSGNRAMMDSIMATDEYKALSAAEKDFFSYVEKVNTGIVEENKDSFWGPLMMIATMSYFTPEQIPTYESLSDEAKNSYYGQKVYEELYPAGKVGDEVKDFKIGDSSLAEFCKGKKVVLIDFWASWCRPCRKEIPNLKAIYEKYKDQGFDIVSVSIDDDEAAWQKALDQEKLPWTNVRDADDAIAKLYKVSAVPTIYVIDGDHKLLNSNLHGEELSAAIDSLMAE